MEWITLRRFSYFDLAALYICAVVYERSSFSVTLLSFVLFGMASVALERMARK